MSQEIDKLVLQQKAYFNTDATYPYDFRLAQLYQLKDAMLKYTPSLVEALNKDLGRPEFEAYFELAMCFHEVNGAIKNLKKWMKPKKIKTDVLAQPGKSRIEYCPVGQVLIMVPYNYPAALTIQPLVGAIAAGNTAIIKASSVTPATSSLLDKMLNDAFDAQYICSLQGSTEVTNVLLEQKFDHIFFTGSPNVGRIVMAAAAKHLTPVTLELGGKSPTIVNRDCNLEQAVKRIVSGRFLNAGQTCIAPDHVYVHQDIKEQFLAKIKAVVTEFYSENPIQSKDFGRIINDRHFNRVSALIPQDRVVVGGQIDASQKFIAPTVVKDVTFDDDIMQEEIFGPVLPVMTFTDIDDVRQQIAKLPEHPLAMYIFTKDKAFEQELVRKVRCGGVNVNSTLMHVANSHMAFGGFGESGMGAYHGQHSFELFSHAKGVVKSATWLDIPLRYAPYTGKVKWLKKLIK
ncbi:aldehyde dehydrogenase [Thalassotalea atypica]|uniref:aldehyde dehydrogenase n=1 Tax=Thalassotalea atypica TaxID=2054316 RepID=UPI0025738A32|nr:aldehyde dehydrogenase [Thalassotalea atypica]